MSHLCRRVIYPPPHSMITKHGKRASSMCFTLHDLPIFYHIIYITPGPFSIPGGFFAVGYYSTSTNEHPEIPDIQFYGTATHLFGNPFVFPGSIQHLNDTTNYPDSNSLAIVLARPHTQEGELKLQSTDPAGTSKIIIMLHVNLNTPKRLCYYYLLWKFFLRFR